MSTENAATTETVAAAAPSCSPATATATVTSTLSDTGNRKRGRSPPGPPFMEDYRPYSSGLLQGRLRSQLPEMHKRQWDLYYRNNTINGYKDRHYIVREFHELRAAIDAAVEYEEAVKESRSSGSGVDVTAAPSFSWMEAGCGVGNAMLPIFEAFGHVPQWRALLGFDISSVAIQLLEEKKAALPPVLAAKVHVCVLNPSESDVTGCSFFQRASPSSSSTYTPLPEPCAFPEFVSLIFVLCSIPVASHAAVVQRIKACMRRPGGVLYFRDYAVSDHAEARFRHSNRQVRLVPAGDAGEQRGAEAEANTYARTNGTLSHFFSTEEVRQLFEGAGFEVIALGVIENEVTNRKTSVSFARRFVQGRFRLLE